MFVAPDATHVNYEKLLTYLSAAQRRALAPLDSSPPPSIARAVNEPSPMDRRGTTYASHFARCLLNCLFPILLCVRKLLEIRVFLEIHLSPNFREDDTSQSRFRLSKSKCLRVHFKCFSPDALMLNRMHCDADSHTGMRLRTGTARRSAAATGSRARRRCSRTASSRGCCRRRWIRRAFAASSRAPPSRTCASRSSAPTRPSAACSLRSRYSYLLHSCDLCRLRPALYSYAVLCSAYSRLWLFGSFILLTFFYFA